MEAGKKLARRTCDGELGDCEAEVEEAGEEESDSVVVHIRSPLVMGDDCKAVKDDAARSSGREDAGTLAAHFVLALPLVLDATTGMEGLQSVAMAFQEEAGGGNALD